MREAEEEQKRINLAGLAKCALIASFLLALAIWWCVPDAADMPHQPPSPHLVRPVRHRLAPSRRGMSLRMMC